MQDEEVLRDMFVQLLATSMTREHARSAHPAFAEFIKQMTPLEARLVRAMARYGDIATLTIRDHEAEDVPQGPYPHASMSENELIQLLEEPPTGSWQTDYVLTAFDVPAGAPATSELAAGLGNLERLALVRTSHEITFASPSRYLKVANCERAVSRYAEIAKGNRIAGLHTGMISVTALGRQFMRACLPRKKKESGG